MARLPERITRLPPRPKASRRSRTDDTILLHKDRAWTLSFESGAGGIPSATLTLCDPAIDYTECNRHMVREELNKIFNPESESFALSTNPGPREVPASVTVSDDHIISVTTQNPEDIAFFLAYAAANAPKGFKINTSIDEALMERDLADDKPLLAAQTPVPAFTALLDACGMDQNIAARLQPVHLHDKRVAGLREYYHAQLGTTR